MTLLEMTGEEIYQKIENELASNPALEIINEIKCPNCKRTIQKNGQCAVCNQLNTEYSEQPIIFVSPRTNFQFFDSSTSDDDSTPEEWTAAKEDLPAYVLRQIAPELEKLERPIAAHILSSLDEDGLLSVPVLEIANYTHHSISQINKVINIIQRAEPVGVGSPSVKDALIIQLKVLSESQKIPKYSEEIVKSGLNLLSRRAYHDLAKKLGISHKEVKKAAQFISQNLNPFPARAHWGDLQNSPDTPPTYQNPDIIITKLNDKEGAPLVVEIISPFSGYLRVNPLFRKALSDAPSEKIDQWQNDVEKATLLVKCLQQRTNTMVRLMEILVVIQRQFILKGDAYINPVTRAKLADELGVHESTISRAVASKALQLPNKRIIPLSKLFDRSLHIRTALKQIIKQEKKPLSDTQIADLLTKRGHTVARRTVAKYRAMEGILPARLRRTNSVQAL
jgi:RNA polymerase sigma-54 factor